jgi:hypothetical protein
LGFLVRKSGNPAPASSKCDKSRPFFSPDEFCRLTTVRGGPDLIISGSGRAQAFLGLENLLNKLGLSRARGSLH